MSVKRYDYGYQDGYSADGMTGLQFADDGALVKYEDYAALEAKCAALAAENAWFIEQAEEVYAAGYNHGHLNTVDGIAYADCVKDDFYGLAVELMCEAETPATDAYLAEVRAQGVEMAACALDDVNQFNYANMLDDLAQKLRKGAAQ